MIKNIIFDLGGVLIDFNPKKVIGEHFNAEDGAVILSRLFGSVAWREVDRGTLAAEEACRQIKEYISPEAYAELVPMIENWGNYMPEFEDMYTIVEKLKAKGLKIYLLSNIPFYFYDIKDRIKALSLFDGFVISADLKLLKPEPEIFEATLEKFSLTAEECLFVDDTAANTEAAEKCGLHAHCFNHSDLQHFIDSLASLGIEI